MGKVKKQNTLFFKTKTKTYEKHQKKERDGSREKEIKKFKNKKEFESLEIKRDNENHIFCSSI